MAGSPGEGPTTLDEALAVVDGTNEHYLEAELHRLRAQMLLTLGEDAEAEAWLHRVVEVARRQQTSRGCCGPR
jgi:adenylate cyclase